MPTLPLLSAEMIARFRVCDANSNARRAQTIRQLDDNPFGAEIRSFGAAVAIKFRSSVLRSKNRVLNFGEADQEHLDEMLRFYRQDGLRCSFSLAALGIGKPFARRLADRQVFVTGGAGTFYGVPLTTVDLLPERITVREIARDDLSLFLDVFLAANEVDESQWQETRLFESLENTQPGYRLFMAFVDGNAAAVGSMHIGDGIGSLVAGATLPQYRRIGCQTALLQRRLFTAHEAGCDLVVGNASWFSTSQHNLERAGLRPIQFGLHAQDFGAL